MLDADMAAIRDIWNVDSIKFADGTTMTSAGGSSGGGIGDTIRVDTIYPATDNPFTDKDAPSISFEYWNYNHLGVINKSTNIRLDADYVRINKELLTSFIDAMETSTGQLNVGVIDNFGSANRQYIEVINNIYMPDHYIECRVLTQVSDKSLKENIRYIDEPIKRTSDDLLDKADLHDFIVNQVSICEYNFIGDTSDNIGFIANDYEGTKVGDKIVSRKNDTLSYDVSNLLFATIGALQEEVRMRDEKIATLEDRLAKIEEMLGINNK
jgi:hypothetical protein